MPFVYEAGSWPEGLGVGRDACATPLGTSGAFVLTWVGGGQINVQRYDVDGRPLDAAPYRYAAGTWVRAAALGNDGEFIVVSGDGRLVYAQRFDAGGATPSSPRVTLDGPVPGGADNWPEVCALGSAG